MLVLIDGDIFRYRCAFAAERNYYLVELINANGHKEWKEFDTKKEASEYEDRVTRGVSKASTRIWSRKEIQPIENCLQIVKASLETTLKDIEQQYGKVEYRIFLSGKTNFREKIAVSKPYKGNRDTAQKPAHYTRVGEYLTTAWNAETTQGIEADDAIGIGAMDAKERGERYIVVSNDKDLNQIPGLHYNWVSKEFYEVSGKEAKTRFFIQLLAGDATDNIQGIPGIGEVTAAKILAECKSPEEMVDKVHEEYRKYLPDSGEHQEYLLEMANLVYILKKKDTYWIDTKDGIYWEDRYNSQVPH